MRATALITTTEQANKENIYRTLRLPANATNFQLRDWGNKVSVLNVDTQVRTTVSLNQAPSSIQNLLNKWTAPFTA